MLQHWIWLSTRKSLSDKWKVSLLEHFHDPEQIYFAGGQDFSFVDFLTAEAVESLMDKDLTGAAKILEQCVDCKIQVMTFFDDIYPSRLKNIPDPPMVLYYKGKLPDLDGTPTIGVVGTRKASAYGMKAAKQLGYQIAKCGGIVVSGLAAGIDAMAMEGALSAGSSIVGVLGCGADVVYPAANRRLYAETERYGCILTEFPPKTKPFSQNFPRRNRIISGLSDGIVVVEAPQRSGALITAQKALDQGRDVFALPANIDSPNSVGCNMLVRDGATLVTSGWEVLSEYEGRYPGKIRNGGEQAQLWDEPHERLAVLEEAEKKPGKTGKKSEKKTLKEEKPEHRKKKAIDNWENEPYIDLTKINFMSEHERIIVDQLVNGKKLVDDVIADSGLKAPLVLSSLTLLEVRGIVRRLPGRFIELGGK